MNTLLETAHFSRPYLARYWPRFVLGIVLGILFGASNSLSLGSIYIIANRLDDPIRIQEQTAKARQVQLEKEQGESPMVHGLKAKATALKQQFYLFIDPWLPLKDRPLDWKQCLGGFSFFIPLTFMLRGLLGLRQRGYHFRLETANASPTTSKATPSAKSAPFRLNFPRKTTTNELIARIESDGTALNNFLKMGLSDMVKEPSTIFFMLGIMFLIDWKFTLISLTFALKASASSPPGWSPKKSRISDSHATSPPAVPGRPMSPWNHSKTSASPRPTPSEEVHARAFFKSGPALGSLQH